MKFVLVLIVVVGATLVVAAPAKKNAQKPCLQSCTLDYKPVCGAEGKEKPKSFGSICVMENYNCEHGSNLKKISEGECPGGGGVRLS